jgi:hypothetical protein
MDHTRRKSPRVLLKMNVNQIEGTDFSEVGELVNLSRSGLAVTFAGSNRRNALRFAWLQFCLPNGERVRALGEVMHEKSVQPREQVRGFRFKYIAPRERIALNEFMSTSDA